MSVIALLESCVSLLHLQLPFINELVIQSDNATTYQNGHLVFGIHLLNIKMKNKIFISDFIHSETQHGKTILDAHFASTNRHLKNFMLSYKQNQITRIQTPHGLAFSLSFNSGVRNTMVQLIEFDEKILEQLSTALNPIVKSAKEYFTRVNHIYYELPSNHIPYDQIYNNLSDISFCIKVQAFTSIDDPVVFNVNIGNNTFEPAADNSDCFGDTSDKHPENVTDADDSGDVSANNDSGHLLHNTMESTLQEQDFSFGCRTHHKRHHLRKTNIANIESSIVDSTVQQKNDNDSTSSSSDDEDYVVEDSDYEESDSETFADNVHECDIRKYSQPTEVEFNQMFTGVTVIRQQDFGTILSFKKRSTNKHVTIEENDMIQERQDVYAKTVRYASNIITNSSYFHSSDNPIHPLYESAKDYLPTHKIPFNLSWACRKGYGQLYGETYMEPYKDELLKMFEHGNKDSAKKMNPGKMREQLMIMFPHKFSIPSETEIKKFINSESQKLKYKSKKKNSSEQRGRKPKGSIEQMWISSLKPIVENHISESPEAIYKRFLSSFLDDEKNHPPDLPKTGDGGFNKKKIKTTIYQIKTKMKKQAKKSLV